jgi:sulfite reductase beta subunit-like hemoprotein
VNGAILPAQEAELQHFTREIAALQSGARDADDFKRFRLVNGVYGIRETTDRHMIRIKIRFGALTADQLDAIADAAERFTPLRLAHVTTRQCFQLHNVAQNELPAALRVLAARGLTSREACGNTVRNVTCCPLAGVAADEPFDVTPYADGVSAFFLRHPVGQNLPRKFKMAFEGCATDHARLAIHDLGFRAVVRDGQRGFHVMVGGGLGAVPMSAQVLEEFLPVELLIPSIEAALRLFDRHGNRHDRNKARLKFVLKDRGLEEFRKQWLAEQKIARLTRSGAANWDLPATVETAPPVPQCAPVPGGPGFARWRETNCLPQQQAGYFTVLVRCPLGDLTVAQMRGVAAIARRFTGGRLRTAISQNLLLRWVPESHVPNAFNELAALGLALPDAQRLPDITRCPGADTCQLAITHSRGLATALGEVLPADAALQGLALKISGCPNGCGQHAIADIGFSGCAKTVAGKSVEHYRIHLGGGTAPGRAWFGTVAGMVPAAQVPAAVAKLLVFYRDHRQVAEDFAGFVQRLGAPRLKEALAT